MAVKSQETKIKNSEGDLVDYETTQFPAMKSLRLSIVLAKTIGAGIGDGFKGADLKNFQDVDVGALIKGVLTNLDEDETPKLLLSLLENTKRNGVFINHETFDKVYSGADFMEIIEAVKWVLEVNYGGFIKAIAQGKSTGVAA